MKTAGRRSLSGIGAALLGTLLLGGYFWACGNTGGGAGTPTGPDSKNNPEANTPRATITLGTPGGNFQPGDLFGMTAIFRDNKGIPLEGIWITFYAESKSILFGPNPSVTNKAGLASTEVGIAIDALGGSYTIMATSSGGPTAVGYTVIHVGDPIPERIDGLPTVTGPSTIAAGASATYTALGASSSQGHAIQYSFDFGDEVVDYLPAGTDVKVKSWANAGTYNVRAKARCATHTTVTSSWGTTLTVTVTP